MVDASYNTGQHAPKAPEVEGVVVLLVVHEQLRACATQPSWAWYPSPEPAPSNVNDSTPF